MNLEQKLIDQLRKNETIVQILPFNDLVKEYESVRPWMKTAANYVAPTKDSIVAFRLLKEFGLGPEKVTVKLYNQKKYIIFKGYPGKRNVFRGTRYLADNPKIVRMAVGPKGLKSSVRGGFVLSVVLCTSIEIFSYFMNDSTTLPHLLGTITSEIFQIGIISIAAAAAGLMVGTATVIGSSAALPLLAAIGVGVVTGKILEVVDKRYGVTNVLIKAYAELGMNLKDIRYETNRWLNYFETHPWEIQRLFGCPSIFNVPGY